MRRVAILAASGRELAPARAALGPIRRGRLNAFRHQVGKAGGTEVHLIETGMGPEAALAAARAVLDGVDVDTVVSTGYAGALELAEIGDVILGTDVLNWTKERSRTVFHADSASLSSARKAAGNSGLVWSEGPVVTVAQIVWRAAEKQALGRASGAIAVDMESAAIAQAAADKGVPFLVVRAVSDRAGEDLPMDFNLWFAPFGAWRCLLEIAKRPSILSELDAMARNVNIAAESLAKFHCALLELLESHVPQPDPETPLTAGVR
jgi:adenosylhomocysteine nucleosidase